MHGYLTFCLYTYALMSIILVALRLIGVGALSLPARVKTSPALFAPVAALILILAVILPGSIYLQFKGMISIGVPVWALVVGVALNATIMLADKIHKREQKGSPVNVISTLTLGWLMYLGLQNL